MKNKKERPGERRTWSLLPKALRPRIEVQTQEERPVVAIIGAGPAGMEAAIQIARQSCQVLLFEANADLALNLQNKYKLFPDMSDAQTLAQGMMLALEHPLITVYRQTPIKHVVQVENFHWQVFTEDNRVFKATAVLLCTGYEVFDARRKEELGYGIYNGVITSLELENMFKQEHISTLTGDSPKRVVFLQCVGSRDEKVGNRYCSKVCCVTAVKQAIELKRMHPETEVYVFYMDLRMWGKGFEEMYRVAQEQYNIRFVRGRISEAAGTFDGGVQIKAEDTLIGKPLKMRTDLLVLMLGMEASCGTKQLAKSCGIVGDYGFAGSLDPHLNDNHTHRKGLFLAGTCKRPMSLTDVIADARSAAMEIINYLSKQ